MLRSNVVPLVTVSRCIASFHSVVILHPDAIIDIFFCRSQSLYCVPVPGETFWVKEFDADVRAGEKAEEESMQTEPTTAQVIAGC